MRIAAMGFQETITAASLGTAGIQAWRGRAIQFVDQTTSALSLEQDLPLMMTTEQIGPLQCTVVDHQVTDEGPDLAVILCHGYGAPGVDLVPIGQELSHLLPKELGVRFLFPQAPILLDEFGGYDARAWWELSINRLLSAIESGQVDVLKNVRPEGLDESRELLLETCNEFLQRCELPWSRVILGGFSQGAMLTTDLALRLPQRPAHLAILSGTLLNESEWQQLSEQGEPLKVLQSHGKLDPVLPFVAAEWLRDLLAQRHEVEFIEFMGPHTIPGQVIHNLVERLLQTPHF